MASASAVSSLIVAFTLLVAAGATTNPLATPPSSYSYDVNPVAQLFVTVHPRMGTAGIDICDKKANLKTCQRCSVNLEILRKGAMIMAPDGTILYQSEKTKAASGQHRTAATYTGFDPGTEAHITFSDRDDYAVGQMFLAERSFSLANCGGDCHVWIEHKVDNVDHVDHVSNVKNVDHVDDVDDVDDVDWSHLAEAEPAKRDEAAMTEVSVRVYITHEFAALEPDVAGYIADLIDITNIGYENSEIYVRLRLLCVELTDISEEELNANGPLSTLLASKGDWDTLLNTADVSFLLMADGPCGITFGRHSVSNHACAPRYAFSHEVGHLLGAGHNVEVSAGGVPYAHGFLIPNGYRTIMAYPAAGHGNQVNYYSSDSILYEGNPTGNATFANNARRINEVAPQVAPRGNESAVCEPTNGGWSSWGSWSCVTHCGVSPAQVRRRSCSAPFPLNGGATCQGPSLATREVACDTGATCPTCSDKESESNCQLWQSQGKCANDSLVMEECARTCGLCIDVCVEEEVDYQGYDLKWLGINNPDECRKACKAHKDCLFYTQQYGSCYLKSSNAGRRPLSACTAGSVAGPCAFV